MTTNTEPASSLVESSKTGSTNAEVQHTHNSQQEQQAEVIDNEEAAVMARKVRTAKQHKKWNRRLKIFFCCLGYKKNKDSIADVASILAEFYADLDVPSSDVAAGFVLLSKYQAAQRQWIVDNHLLETDQYLSSIPITKSTNFLDISTAEDSHLINDLIYYMNYSLAIFGWPMQVVDDPCMLCCIFPYLKMCSCCCGGRGSRGKVGAIDEPEKGEKKGEGAKADGDEAQPKTAGKSKRNLTSSEQDSKQIEHSTAKAPVRSQPSPEQPGVLADNCDIPIILDDNCCGCNAASVDRRLAAHNYEIIYITYRVDVNIVPFLVIADHSKQTIVVAMRGSMSLSDMVTDMNGQADKVPIENCPDDWLSHRGITRAANYVAAKLKEEHILERAFNCRPDLNSQDYKLVFCGHSLGAGVAAILGILMRPEYPTLKAYLYSPPGGVLSLPVVEYTKEFATGIILGNDCVPRLGLAQLERLRYHVLLSVKSSEQSTSKILTKAICPTCCFGGNKVEYDPTKSLDLLHGVEGRSFDYNGNKIPFQVQPQILYVPGRIIHIVKNYNFKTSRRFFNEPIYQAIWNENITYDRIVISEGMLFDHLPNHLMHAMKMLFSKTLPGRKDSKSSSVNNETCPEIGRTPQNDGGEFESGDCIGPKESLDRVVTSGKDNSDENVIEKDDKEDEDRERNVGKSDENNNSNSNSKLPVNVETNDDLTIESSNLNKTKSIEEDKIGYDNNGNDNSFTDKNESNPNQIAVDNVLPLE